jgi:hypothetical protein
MLAGEATVHLCLVTTGTDGLAKLVLGESFGEEVFWYLHINSVWLYWHKSIGCCSVRRGSGNVQDSLYLPCDT